MTSQIEQILAIRNQSSRKKRIPRSATNLSTPRRFEKSFEKRLVAILNRVAEDIRRRIVPQLPEMVADIKAEQPRSDSIRNDVNVARRLAQLIAATRAALSGVLSEAELEAEMRDAGFELDRHNKAKIAQMYKTALGIDIFFQEPWLANTMDNFALEAASLIKNVSDEMIQQTQRIVMQGLRQGVRHEEIAKQLLGTSKDIDGKVSLFTKSKSRARLIARDQMNKLNGKLTELRQREAGLTKYRWRTVGDDRVREDHRRVDNEIFTWEKNTSEGGVEKPKGRLNPGEDIQCRCYAEPVFDV